MKLPGREILLVALLLALLGYAAAVDPTFVTLRSQTLLASHLWELAMVAVPMLLIIVAGGIDLSVGSMVALSSVTFGLVMERGVPLPVAGCAAVLVGGLQGGLNGWLIAKTRAHPLLITLASMAAFRGVAEGVSSARPRSGYPAEFTNISGGPLPALAFLVLAISAHLLLSRVRLGRWVLALGTNETATRFSRIPVDRVRLQLFLFSGLVCGLAALFMVARNNTAQANLGERMELDAITAVVLGGASIEGGKGRVLGLVLGLILIHETREFVSWHFRQNEFVPVVVGLTLLLAMLAERTLSQSRIKL